MGRALTVTGDRYQAMITTFLAPAVKRMMNQEWSLWFQQNGATCQCKGINGLPQTTVPGRLISRYGDLPWPPRSPDFFMGLPEGKGIPNKAHGNRNRNYRTLFAEKSLAYGRKHWHQWWSGWYGEYSTVWLSVAVTYCTWFSGHNLWTISNMCSFISTLLFL
jgi:hypothetical protein